MRPGITRRESVVRRSNSLGRSFRKAAWSVRNGLGTARGAEPPGTGIKTAVPTRSRRVSIRNDAARVKSTGGSPAIEPRTVVAGTVVAGTVVAGTVVAGTVDATG